MQCIKKDAIFLFTDSAPTVEHNHQCLAEIHSKSKPIAIIPSTSKGNAGGKAVNLHFDKDLPMTAIMCIGAIVTLVRKNFKPSWGLHNGSISTVIAIVHATGESLNDNNLQLFVVVKFPSYCAPQQWDAHNPKHVPIPCITVRCEKVGKCCSCTYIPLVLSFARAIHRFQGLSAGLTDPNKIPNLYQCIICHPNR